MLFQKQQFIYCLNKILLILASNYITEKKWDMGNYDLMNNDLNNFIAAQVSSYSM